MIEEGNEIMSIDKDPEVYKLLIGAVMALLGILNMVGFNLLNNIKKNIEILFGRVNRTDQKVTQAVTNIENMQREFSQLRTDCRENHRRP